MPSTDDSNSEHRGNLVKSYGDYNLEHCPKGATFEACPPPHLTDQEKSDWKKWYEVLNNPSPEVRSPRSQKTYARGKLWVLKQISSKDYWRRYWQRHTSSHHYPEGYLVTCYNDLKAEERPVTAMFLRSPPPYLSEEEESRWEKLYQDLNNGNTQVGDPHNQRNQAREQMWALWDRSHGFLEDNKLEDFSFDHEYDRLDFRVQGGRILDKNGEEYEETGQTWRNFFETMIQIKSGALPKTTIVEDMLRKKEDPGLNTSSMTGGNDGDSESDQENQEEQDDDDDDDDDSEGEQGKATNYPIASTPGSPWRKLVPRDILDG